MVSVIRGVVLYNTVVWLRNFYNIYYVDVTNTNIKEECATIMFSLTDQPHYMRDRKGKERYVCTSVTIITSGIQWHNQSVKTGPAGQRFPTTPSICHSSLSSCSITFREGPMIRLNDLFRMMVQLKKADSQKRNQSFALVMA